MTEEKRESMRDGSEEKGERVIDQRSSTFSFKYRAPGKRDDCLSEQSKNTGDPL